MSGRMTLKEARMLERIATLTRRGPALRTLVAAGVIGTAACYDSGRPVGPSKELDVPQMQPDLQAQMEQTFLHPDVAKLVATAPGFGGFYLDAGVPTVYLTDVGQRAKVEAALAAYGKVRVLQGQYTYKQLDGWFWQLSPEALALPGAVFVDLDEARNRVFVGVEHAAAAAAVRGVTARLGLPAGAVLVEEVEPIHLTSTLPTLLEPVRPVVGGLKITGRYTGYPNFTCTLGFNAVWSGQSSFITNSHCTHTRSLTEGTRYFQPDLSGNYWIGTEVDDPALWQVTYVPNGQYFRRVICPWRRWCRFSDAARAAYESGVTGSLGRIAHTSAANNSSLEITGNFVITGEMYGVIAGSTVANKVGSTTGWTQGRVKRACVNADVGGTNITLICQTVVGAYQWYGDSGSPVFLITSPPDVALLGISWGCTIDDNTKQCKSRDNDPEFWYSPIAGIQRDLGELQTY